jgi:hypothetical protein
MKQLDHSRSISLIGKILISNENPPLYNEIFVYCKSQRGLDSRQEGSDLSFAKSGEISFQN